MRGLNIPRHRTATGNRKQANAQSTETRAECDVSERQSRGANPVIGQRLAPSPGFLQPMVAAAGSLSEIANLGDAAREVKVAGARKHLVAVDFESFANIRPGDALFEQHLYQPPFGLCT